MGRRSGKASNSSASAWADAAANGDPRAIKYVDGKPHSLAIQITGYGREDGTLVDDNGQRIDAAVLADWRKPARSKAPAQAHQGVEKPREYRNVSLDNILTVSVGGVTYRRTHA